MVVVATKKEKILRILGRYAIVSLSVCLIVFLIYTFDTLRKKEIAFLLKKNYDLMNSVIAMSEVENGFNTLWKLPESDSFEDMEVFLNKYYLPYMSGAKVVKSETYEGKYSIFVDETTGKTSEMINNYLVLREEAVMSFFYNKEDNYMLLFIDINGTAKPNRMGRDVFVCCCFNGKRHVVRFLEDNNNIGNINALMKNEGFGCNKENTGPYRNFYCGRVIELSNWKIPLGYPL